MRKGKETVKEYVDYSEGTKVVGDLIKNLRSYGKCQVCGSPDATKHNTGCVAWAFIKWRDSTEQQRFEFQDQRFL